MPELCPLCGKRPARYERAGRYVCDVCWYKAEHECEELLPLRPDGSPGNGPDQRRSVDNDLRGLPGGNGE